MMTTRPLEPLETEPQPDTLSAWQACLHEVAQRLRCGFLTRPSWQRAMA